MQSYRVEGVVIKRSNLKEADRIVTLFSKQKGKLTVVAKGVRKLTSRRGGSLELFNLLKAQIISGRGDLDILAEVEVISANSSWRKHLGRVTLAYQLCEAVDKLTPEHQPYPHIFEILTQALSSLGTLGDNWEQMVKNWLVEILTDLGYWSPDKKFTGDIWNYIEDVSEKAVYSPKFLNKLKKSFT